MKAGVYFLLSYVQSGPPSSFCPAVNTHLGPWRIVCGFAAAGKVTEESK